MNPILRNILALVAGIILGSIVNMLLITLGHSIIPPPGDISTMEAMTETMLIFQPIDYLFPFIAHAGGTLFGAFIAAKIAADKKKVWAMVIAFLFLSGGIYMVLNTPSPIWFTILDLGFAYIPMAWIGWRLAK